MKRWLLVALLIAAPVLLPRTSLAQGPQIATQPLDAPAPMVLPQKNYMIDAGVVVLLCGGAVFAVCRSSKRV